MTRPRADRPYMPGYGIRGEAEGGGLLPWSWAVERIEQSRGYWVSTVRPDGRPHAMPVWAVWDAGALWFCSSAWSRKIRNLHASPHCVITTEDTSDPVVIEGVAETVTEPAVLQRFVDLLNGKYATDFSLDFLDPAENSTVAVWPRRVFGLRHEDFTGSPTRWAFDGPEAGGA